MKVPGRLAWRTDVAESARVGFAVYAARSPDEKGELVARTTDTEAVFEIEEGDYFFRALRVYKDHEEDWQEAEVFRQAVKRESPAPADPTGTSIVHVEPDSQLRLKTDPVAQADPEGVLELIEGTTPEQGRLLATLGRRHEAADLNYLTEGAPSRDILAHGSGQTGDRTLWLRSRSWAGTPGAAPVQVTLPYFDRINTRRRRLLRLAAGVLNDDLYAGVPPNTVGWEFTGGQVRTLKIPAANQITAANGWGSAQTGKFATHKVGAEYLNDVLFESVAHDLGAKLAFTLELWSDLERDAQAMGSLAATTWGRFPANPSARIEDRHGPMTTAHFLREYRQNGRAKRPLTDPVWLVKYGDASPITMAYRQAFPGERVAARHIQIALAMRDKLGKQRLRCTAINCEAVFNVNHLFGMDTFTAGQTQRVVTIPTDPATAVQLCWNALVPVCQEQQLGEWWTRVVAVNPAAGQFTVALQDNAGAPYVAVGGESYWWQAIGW